MGAILLAITIGGIVTALGLLIVSILTRKAWLRNFVLGGLAIWFAFYLVAFAASSFFSREKTLGLNEPKKFCGFYLDCHLSASVTGVRRSKSFGRLTAENEFYIVKIKVASNARRAALGLSAPEFIVIDAEGRRSEPVEDLTVSVREPKFAEKIPAGKSIEDEIAFDLPPDVQNPRLDIREGGAFERALEAILIGDEDGLLHKRSYFGLKPAMAKF